MFIGLEVKCQCGQLPDVASKTIVHSVVSTKVCTFFNQSTAFTVIHILHTWT